MTKPQDLLSLAQATIHYAQAVANTAQCKDTLHAGYHAWRIQAGIFEYVPHHSDAWKAMMLATAGEYKKWRNAKKP